VLPEIIPLFPLPDVVFFPRMVLPLHIFEPRYRAMVQDASHGARMIGMVCLRGDWQASYAARTTPIFPIGTAGEITRIRELPDGRFDIILRGLSEFGIERELDRGTAYREAVVSERSFMPDGLKPGLRATIADLVTQFLARSGRPAPPRDVSTLDVDDETFVNFFSQHLPLTGLDKQALLEARRLSERAGCLRDVLEFALEELRASAGAPTSGRPH